MFLRGLSATTQVTTNKASLPMFAPLLVVKLHLFCFPLLKLAGDISRSTQYVFYIEEKLLLCKKDTKKQINKKNTETEDSYRNETTRPASLTVITYIYELLILHGWLHCVRRVVQSIFPGMHQESQTKLTSCRTTNKGTVKTISTALIYLT